MKNINNFINENQSLSALYLKNEDGDTWTISNKVKDIDSIQITWDQYAGIYFIGTYEKLQILQKGIKEETIIEKDAF